ncbi:MAG: trypsin-like serine protease [Acidobacteria bacterium]|nr:trypsin-like serine protease [Acidobacteriota bacterium]
MKNLFFLGLALLMAIPPVNSAIVIRHDRADERYLKLGARYPAVGRVGRRMGDGTLIGDRWVLTAAHVARGLMRRSPEPSVFFGDSVYRVGHAYIHPDWVDMGPHDIAVLELTETVKDIEPLALYTRKDEQGRVAVMVGHGRTGTGDNRDRRDDDKKRGATNRIEEVNDHHIVFRFDAPPNGTDLEGIPSGGDSGGPALLEVDGVALVAGVSSAGRPGPGGPGTYGALDYFTRASTHADWVRRVLDRKVSPAVFTQSRPGSADLNAEQWRADLRFMAEEMAKTHKNLFHTISREQFETEVNKLHERIPQLARHQIIVELMRIVAMVGDGHTNIAPTRDPKIGFRALPVKLYLFKDGLIVRAATREHAALVGVRVMMVGNASADEAVRRAIEITGRDNEMGARYFAPFLLTMPEMLHALGLSGNPDETQFVIEKDGRRQTVTLKPTGQPEMMPADTDVTWMAREGWVDLRDQASVPLPLWLKDPQNKFWFEYLPDTKTVYAQINQVGDKEQETLAAFSERLFTFINANPVEKMILDLRLNRGGNGELLRPLVTGLIKSKLDQPGKLFAIMGRSTWSAAQFLLNHMEHWTNVIFVGEPSGSKGNHYGDSRRITLPNSGITVRVSIYYWQDWSPWDFRQWTAPHLTAELTSEDYRTNADPALKTIQNYVPQKTLTEVLEGGLAKNDLELTAKLFRQFKAEPVNRYLHIENQMIELGYRLLREKKQDAGLLILQLNVETNLQSAIAHAALADAFLFKGEKELALKHYEKSFTLYPGNFDVREKLKQLRQK